jgi:hypothetical protein
VLKSRLQILFIAGVSVDTASVTPPPSTVSDLYSGWGMKLSAHLNLRPGLRRLELYMYLHSPVSSWQGSTGLSRVWLYRTEATRMEQHLSTSLPTISRTGLKRKRPVDSRPPQNEYRIHKLHSVRRSSAWGTRRHLRGRKIWKKYYSGINIIYLTYFRCRL